MALRKVGGPADVDRLADAGLAVADVIGMGVRGAAEGIDVATRLTEQAGFGGKLACIIAASARPRSL